MLFRSTGSSIILKLDEALADTAPSANRFQIKRGRRTLKISDVTIDPSNAEVKLDLATAINPGSALSLAYRTPRRNTGVGIIQDAAGNALKAFRPRRVTNTSSIQDADAITGLATIQDANHDGLVDGLANYHLLHEGRAIPLTNRQGQTYSDAYSDWWDAIAATNQGSGYQVLLDGASTYENKYQVWDTNSQGVITKQSDWKTTEQALNLGWGNTFADLIQPDQANTNPFA